jgi:predicted MFS family arabinose efflux permease
MISHDRPATRLATRLAFLVVGFGIACLAPLVPFAKQRLAVDDATLGVLLLCIGIGSVAAMQFTGAFSARYVSKPATPSWLSLNRPARTGSDRAVGCRRMNLHHVPQQPFG